MHFLKTLFLISAILFSVTSSDALAISHPAVYDEEGKALFQPGSANRRFCLGIAEDAKLTPALISSARYFAVAIAPKFEIEFNKCAGDLLHELSESWLTENKGTILYDAIQEQVSSTMLLVVISGNGAAPKEIEKIIVLDFLSKTPQEQREIEQSFATKIKQKAQRLSQLRREDAEEARMARSQRIELEEQVRAFAAMQATIKNSDYYNKVALVFSGSPLYLGRLLACLWTTFQRGYTTPDGIYEVQTFSQFLGTTFAAYMFTKLMVRQDALREAEALTTHPQLKKHTRISVLAKYVTNLAVVDTCAHWITGQSLILSTLNTVFQMWADL